MITVRRKPKDMRCPVKGCDRFVSVLPTKDGMNARPEDTLVTQHALMAVHLQDDHGAVVGGR